MARSFFELFCEFLEFLVGDEGVLGTDGFIVIDDEGDVRFWSAALEISEEHTFFDVEGRDDFELISGDVEESTDSVDEFGVFVGVVELIDCSLKTDGDPNGVDKRDLDVATTSSGDDEVDGVVLEEVLVVATFLEVEEWVRSALMQLDRFDKRDALLGDGIDEGRVEIHLNGERHLVVILEYDVGIGFSGGFNVSFVNFVDDIVWVESVV